MTVPSIALTRFHPDQTADPSRPLLVVGPSLGTAVRALWAPVAELLAGRFEVVGWDLPGHGDSPAATAGFDASDLAAGVVAAVEPVLAGRGAFAWAGDSLGAVVGLQLSLDRPELLSSAALMCTGAKIGTPESWAERAATVREHGITAVLEGSRTRWFGPVFRAEHPDVVEAVLDGLRAVDAESYALACEALGRFDVRDRLGTIEVPVLAVAGSEDGPTPPSSLREIADGVVDGRLVVLDGVGHLAPVEAPADVAWLLGAHADRTPTQREVAAAGMTVRREVLGDAHVDRATAAATGFTGEFQEFITRYAWGTIWTRPGLDRRSRSMITLTALIARGHHEELAMHVRAARTNGLTVDEIKELILQSAIYCGVPDANTAFRIASQVLAEES